MKTLQFSLFAALFLIVSPAVTYADHHEEEDEEHSPLHEEMEAMDDAFKPLYRALRKPDPAAKGEYLELLQTMQVHAVNAKVYTPRYFEELSAEERSKMLVSYRVDLTHFIGTLLDLERALLADDWEEATAIAARMRTHRKKGHEEYDPE